MTEAQARSILSKKGLRVTAPRLAVLLALSKADSPISHTEVFHQLANLKWDPATIYRNLIKLCEVKVAVVVSRANGIARYALATGHGDDHQHPHFICESCGQIACLISEIAISLKSVGRWAGAIQNATVQLRGNCPDCVQESDGSQS